MAMAATSGMLNSPINQEKKPILFLMINVVIA
jgi:hypothetical protein